MDGPVFKHYRVSSIQSEWDNNVQWWGCLPELCNHQQRRGVKFINSVKDVHFAWQQRQLKIFRSLCAPGFHERKAGRVWEARRTQISLVVVSRWSLGVEWSELSPSVTVV